MWRSLIIKWGHSQLTLVTLDAFSGTEALPCVDVAHAGVAVTPACCKDKKYNKKQKIIFKSESGISTKMLLHQPSGKALILSRCADTHILCINTRSGVINASSGVEMNADKNKRNEKKKSKEG